MTSKKELIRCRDLSVGYDGKAVLHNLNFSVNEGDYLCIVGENGSGKSTLMRTLLHLQPPVDGQLTMDETLHYRIGYLPQQTPVQKDFPASVREIVLSGCQNRSGFRPFYTRTEKLSVIHMMEKLRISHLSGRCYRELSGGQQQRVLLARALCATKKMLLLDEPVSGLDPQVTAEMYQLILKLNRQDGVTIIMISHDIPSVISYSSHVLHIGDSYFFGTKQNYLKSPIGRKFSDLSGGV